MKPKGTILRLAVLSLLLFAVFVQSAWAVDEIAVGGWNIEYLGRPNQRDNSGKGVPQNPVDIAAYIKDSGVHVLGLEEICADKEGGEPFRNQILDLAVQTLNSDVGANWKYELFKARGSKNGFDTDSKARVQLTGIMWNEAVLKPIGTPFRVRMNAPKRIPGEPILWTRWATAKKFSADEGRTDFVIIPVHMKSNRPKQGESEEQAKERSIEHRANEARLLVEALGEVQMKLDDKNIIIIGDMNALNASEKALKIYAEAGFKDLNQQDLVSYISKKHPNSPLDRAFVPDKQPEFSDSKMEVFKPKNMSPEDFRQKFSDHYMIKFTVKVMDDDD
jgi:hypothetical protein